MTKISTFWKKLDGWKRSAIIAIPIAILLITILCLGTDWAEFKTTEEDYIALEEIAHNIVEEKNLFQPLSQKLSHYNIYAKSDGTIEIRLFGTAESITVILTEQFKIKTMYRNLSTVIPCVVIVSAFLIVVSWFISGFLYIVYVGIKKAYLLLKK